MKRKTLRVLVVVICLTSAFSSMAETHPRQIVITFDDLPGVPHEAGTTAAQQQLNHSIVATLERLEIPAIGFVNESRLYVDGTADPDRVDVLRVWTRAGLELGNHSYSHPDLHSTPLELYEADVLRGEVLTREVLEEVNRKPRYFRHPFLHTGRSLEIRNSFVKFLGEHGYAVAPVTMDNSEWIFARGYLRAKNEQDETLSKKIADEYVAYMERKSDYFERQSIALFGREIPQVLLVHVNQLNADHFVRVAAMLQKRGYAFIAIDEALSDEAYQSDDTWVGRGGITWLHRWVLATGKRELIVPDEPRTARFVLDAAGITEE